MNAIFVGECVFHLIPVAPDVVRAEGRADLRQIHFCNPLKGIRHNAMLMPELLLIRDMLPFASSARAERRGNVEPCG